MENNEENIKEPEQFWKDKIKEHWLAFTLCIIGGICCVIGAVIVLIWFMETTPIGLYGEATFDQWSLNWMVGFIILLVLWELLFVGLPAGLVFGLGGWLWWSRLPLDERQEIKDFNNRGDKKRKHRNISGAFNIFLFISFCIYMIINGSYFAEFGSQPYSYWLYSYLQTIAWLLIIFGIPGAIIGVIAYFTFYRKR